MTRFQLLLAAALLVLLARPALAGPPPPLADLSIVKTDLADPVPPGATFLYSIQVRNMGPTSAQSVQWADTLPAGTTFVSVSTPSPSPWSCATPPVGSGGTVTCSLATFSPGGTVFTLAVKVDSGLSPGTVLTNTAQVSPLTFDPIPGNNVSTITTTVGQSLEGANVPTLSETGLALLVLLLGLGGAMALRRRPGR